ncbi:hypothetical protein [Halorubrum sodomense]|uniref:hypothetical protein n=1 Tax=Halorubrum sodomense TaxID=35743 RepID=UPI0011609055|nr:hypothetical protein [Halorubrum sodomense]
MANRRKFLAGLGALASGSAAAVGTGAFTSTAAGREVSVNVAGDQSAYLGLEAGDSDHAYTENGELKLAFDGSQVSGAGVNTNAFIKFNDLFTIRNNSSEKITVWLDQGGSGAPDIGNGADANFLSNVQSNSTGGSIPEYVFFWSFARDDQPPSYDPFGTDGLGNNFETGLDDYSVLAPTNIDTDINDSIFNRAGQHPAVLESGDSLTINFQINTKDQANIDIDPSDLTNASGNVVLNGFSHDFAVDIQS